MLLRPLSYLEGQGQALPRLQAGEAAPPPPPPALQRTLGDSGASYPACHSALHLSTILPSKEQPTREEQMESSKGR